jgi:hypothetical protein
MNGNNAIRGISVNGECIDVYPLKKTWKKNEQVITILILPGKIYL